MNNNETFCGLSRKKAVIVFTLSCMEELIEQGLMTGPKLLTEKGRNQAKELRESGFRPEKEETGWAMNAIMSRKR